MSDAVRDPELIPVPVEGGELAALHWAADAPGAPIAVLVHGITANAMAWARVAGALAGEFEVIAPDLRGRAGSAGLPEPYGLEQHAADVAAVLDTLGADGDPGAEAAVLVGHSMGAHVATLAAAGVARDRVHGLVLVDGGLSFPTPPGADVDAILSAVLGPSLDRLSMTFPDLAAVRAFWAQHPAVGPWVDVPSVAAYLARDLVGEPPALRSACVREAVRVDGGDMLLNERVLEATTDLPVPATLLWATRGLLDQTPGLYDEVRLAELGLEPSGITAREVRDTNHYSILWASQGVEAIAATVREAAARS
ncbi:Lysophospholipase, alpha-beta hydrolase superfamily [Geodermatophilus obscurus]|uniref:Lysophospholipase, alpha-beta hydrolase superfamily n=1 Tax=Geodermatophilus obscurus TaxID=1861 RepID=A0A1M7UZ08_9ACTN|nr:alpha/beta fold hydrolase [Geodermatophilus obscurus]SHN88160.1 Lysophospholipase, alpha-beta hydrolase superfamily [Geodermatophilus obscurus]